MENASIPVQLEDVLCIEHKQIKDVRRRRLANGCVFKEELKRRKPSDPDVCGAFSYPPAWQTDDKSRNWRRAISEAHELNLVGMAFSGGGIRSATFNLGVLQALADLNLLSRIDYLSTVSGGGYIGGWLAAWVKRQGSFAEVQSQLQTSRVSQKEDKEPTPIRFLRVFSNVLTPRLGFFSGDMWAALGTNLRNLLLNQSILIPIVIATMLVPISAEKWVTSERCAEGIERILLLIPAILLTLAFVTIITNMLHLSLADTLARKSGSAKRGQQEVRRRAALWTPQSWILALVCAPIFASTIFGALWPQLTEPLLIADFVAARNGAILYALMWSLAAIAVLILQGVLPNRIPSFSKVRGGTSKRQNREESMSITERISPAIEWLSRCRKPVIRVLSVVAAGAVAGWLYIEICPYLESWEPETVLTLGVPLVLAIFLLAGVLQIGLMGTAFREGKREWWGRVGGWLLLGGILWIAFFWVALYFPYFFTHNALVARFKAEIVAKYLTPAWLLSTAMSVWAGNSKASGEPGTNTWVDAVAKIGPYVFSVGLLCWVSWGNERWIVPLIAHTFESSSTLTKYVPSGWMQILLSAGVLLLFALLMAWRVDVNQFSLHMFYRNQLVKAYLGASNEARRPNRFTGSEPSDDIPLKEFRNDVEECYDGPYPIFNASLNLVKGKDLAWQERKAESFVMTPRHCGYDVWLEEQDSPMQREERLIQEDHLNGAPKHTSLLRRLDRFGYRPTEEYAFPPPYDGIRLGLAMAISGAAACPSMGFYSSPAVAFFLTLFNVRLGQWLGNPRHPRTWRRSTPRLALGCLISELLGSTDDESPYVYLSDGGHFDNLGIYELVKRRCGLIIVFDAEADPRYTFQGLGNAIRKCRIDLGIDIDLDVKDIKPKDQNAPCASCFAIGNIHYENADLAAPKGKIIYFKAALTGSESEDVKQFKEAQVHQKFPQESTLNQWFTESQFESYRKLGWHEVYDAVHGEFSESAPVAKKASHFLLSRFIEALHGKEVESVSDAAVMTSTSQADDLHEILEDFGFEFHSPSVHPEPQLR